RIGRCDEASAVAVAGQSVVVAIEDSINVYVAGHSFQTPESDLTTCDTGFGGQFYHSIPEIGVPISFAQLEKSLSDERRVDSSTSEQPQSGSCSSSVSSIESDTEIKLSHSFSTVDLVQSLSYNKKGNYLLCLECRDAENGESKSSSIRVYFHWNKKYDAMPMRTRIAGVSPSANDLEKLVLTMVELPLTSPATAVASCNISGHLASLSAESVINIFSFRIKEVSGRGKMQYPDFDRLCTVEVPGCSLESLSFMANFISCSGGGKVHVLKVYKSEKAWSPSMVTADKYDLANLKNTARNKARIDSPRLARVNKAKQNFDYSNKVTYDPNDESVTVHLPSITRANRKRAGNTVIAEEYTGEISSNKSKIIYMSSASGVTVEDVLRLSLPQTTSGSSLSHDRFTDTKLYPVRIGDCLGGVTLIVGLTKEAMMYHLPTKDGCHPIRIANYAFTAPLVTFTFDSLFFHALTESGLETYTGRSLYYSLQDYEGFERYKNACPLKNERPCLVGIRPFVKVRFMAANESLICLLACPTPMGTTVSSQPTFSPPLSPSAVLSQDERSWTIYSLELPDIDLLHEDTMRVAKSQENQSDTYVTLLCELHLMLRAHINSTPDESLYYMPRYRNLCKSIGLEHLKVFSTLTAESTEGNKLGTAPQIAANQSCFGLSTSDELLELGVTYLCMAGLDIQQIFALENSTLIQDPQYIAGTVRLIDVLLSSYCAKNDDKHNFSPALSSSIVDFLSRNSTETLVDLVIKVPFLRENNSTRLVEILQDVAATRGCSGKETIALVLTLIAAGGIESNIRSQIRDLLDKVNSEDLSTFLQLQLILDRGAKHVALTDVTICLTAVNSDLPTVILSEAIRNQEVTVSEVMLAFAKAVNLNSESQVQRSLAKALRVILESYFADKISSRSDSSRKLGATELPTNVAFSEDERHAALALVRSYLSDISLSPTNTLMKSSAGDSNFTAEASSDGSHENSNVENMKASQENEAAIPENIIDKADIIARNQIFGKIPSFVNFLLSVETPGGSMTPVSTSFSPSLFSNLENMDSYIRLLSLLSSPCGKIDGVKDSVLNFVYNSSSSVKSTPLQLVLQMFCEPVETAVSILISRQPTTVLLYAKEMFGKSTLKWKTLVTQLKKRINLNPTTPDADMFSTIIESVYLHLANTLSLTELEEVLEKGSDDVAKFRSTCKRVELANSYASMVIQISTDYLQNKQ
ncbi:Hermansky-Pudlak syndrome 3 protein, partial [Orchesella cincta]